MDKTTHLDEEILASFDRGEWRPSSKGQKERDQYSALAKGALTKDRRVSIRISSRDLEDLQARAAEEAIPYQTLMTSVLHKYVTGRLVEPPAVPRQRSITGRAKTPRSA